MASRTLRRGSSGPDVKNLQKSLNAAGAMPKLKEDGKYGPGTEAAVKAFQKKNGLRQDGIVGPKTQQKLSSKTGGGTKHSSGSAGDETKDAWKNILKGQQILKGVDATLQKKVLSFAAKYGPIVIVSGKRTLRKQAELMAPMSDKDLNMYGEKTPYVIEIKALPKNERTVGKVEEILTKARRNGSRISWHIVGKAIDISASKTPKFDWNRANTIAKSLGLKTKLEKSRNSFHVNL